MIKNLELSSFLTKKNCFINIIKTTEKNRNVYIFYKYLKKKSTCFFF